MVKVVVINGRPGCGKTTFENFVYDICNFGAVEGFTTGRRLMVDICSTIDFVKDVAQYCGWDGAKTPKNRKFLSDLKDLLIHWNDVPLKKIECRAKVRALNDGDVDWILFVDCREPSEIQKLKERLNATTVLIRRESVERNEISNRSDADVFNYSYNLTIYNNSDIIHLENEAKKFIEYIKKETFCYEPGNN